MFRTYETVARDTPASRATSALVGTGGGGGDAGGGTTDPASEAAAGFGDFGDFGTGGFGDFDDWDIAVAFFQTGRGGGLADGLNRMPHSG
ncbi:hypothetical protein [Streptomyces subrutilus]|uniref:hypothetical protein n=1 Tax=Streptomyces subrutilus TaxID=36818 RepID=UPI001FCCBCA6|nr:hypothetical protein [Streptomyces subrutilus]